MKKILLGLVMLLTTATMNAQIELEHVFEGNNECYWKHGFASYGVDDLIFIIGNDYKLYVYNADFSFYGAYDADSRIVARNIFTIDNKICFVKKESNDRKITIFDENNKIVNELKFERLTELEYFVAKIGNQYKFMITGWIDDNPNNQVTYIYSCPGNGEATTSVENVPAKVKRNAYPNPASDLVTLPYEVEDATSMKIYDMQGKLVDRKFLDKSKQELQLNVKDYPSGMYFFEVNGESNSFIVE